MKSAARLLTLALSVMPSIAFAQQTPERPSIHLGAAAAVVSYVAPYIAQAQGYFKDEGLDVSIANFQSGVKTMQAVLGGSADAGIGSYGHTITMAAKGQKVRAFVSYLRCPGYSLLVRKGSSVAAVKDLKGMKIGVTSPGSSTHQSLNYLMIKAGLTPTDYTPVSVGNSAGSVAAVKNGKIDATIVVEPLASLLVSGGDATMLLDMRTEQGNVAAFGGPYPEGSLYTTDDFIKANPRTVQAMTNAVVRANKWLQTATAQQVVNALPKEFVGAEPETFARSFENIRSCLSPDGRMTEDGARQVFEIMATSEAELRSASVNLASTYTNDFVDAALKKYGVQ